MRLARDGFFVGYHSRHASPLFVLSCSVVLLFVGLTLERRVRPQVQLS